MDNTLSTHTNFSSLWEHLRKTNCMLGLIENSYADSYSLPYAVETLIY